MTTEELPPNPAVAAAEQLASEGDAAKGTPVTTSAA